MSGSWILLYTVFVILDTSDCAWYELCRTDAQAVASKLLRLLLAGLPETEVDGIRSGLISREEPTAAEEPR